jgi:hypothetical protein
MVQAKRLNIPVVSEEEFVQLFLGQIWKNKKNFV